MKYLSSNRILLKDFTKFAEELAKKIKDHAAAIAQKEEVQYQYLNNSKIRKDELVKSIIQTRGNHPGLVVVLSSLEIENSFDIYRNRDKRYDVSKSGMGKAKTNDNSKTRNKRTPEVNRQTVAIIWRRRSI